MKIEEAIETLEEKRKYCKMFYELSANPQEDYPSTAKFMDALELALTALRSMPEQELEAENKELKERIVNWRKYMAPTREQVEKVWRGEWIIGEPDGLGVPIHCNRCGWGSNHADQKSGWNIKDIFFVDAAVLPCQTRPCRW